MGRKYNFIFSKDGEMIYISHLDLMRLFSRAARRAGLKVELTKGFSPHMKIKFRNALKLGVPSYSQEGEIVLEDYLKEPELMNRLQKELPVGIKILDVKCDPFGMAQGNPG